MSKPSLSKPVRPRVVRLSDLTPPEREVVLALIAAQEAADKAAKEESHADR